MINGIKIVGGEFEELKNIDNKQYSSDFYDFDLNLKG